MKGYSLPAPVIGQRFTEWEVISLPIPGNKALKVPRKVRCRCSCGREGGVAVVSLISGKSQRCRYCGDRTNKQRNVKHGQSYTANHKASPEYNSWVGMLVRCGTAFTQSRHIAYGSVFVHPDWTGLGGFQRFLAYIGPRPTTKHSLDRYPNALGNYEPGNVRWATTAEKNRNKSNIKYHTFQDRTLCVKDWASTLQIPYAKLQQRLKNGMPFELAITEPVGILGYCYIGHTRDPVTKQCATCRPQSRQLRIWMSTPTWLTIDERRAINLIYENCPKGYHVDHVVPLKGKTVCGLHVPWNLRAIPAIENLKKGNKLVIKETSYA